MKLFNFFLEKLLVLTPKYWKLPIEYNLLKITKQLEQELMNLDSLIDKPRHAIDIGANRGFYTYALSLICDHVEAFEPQPWCNEVINNYSESIKNSNITVHKCALSDSNSTSKLHIPILRGKINRTLATGLASLSKPEIEHTSIDVLVKTLDEFKFKDVDFIKIDVEGHESKVIKGAEMTILRDHPTILIEIEQRHLGNTPIDLIFNQIGLLGYYGFFFQNGKLTPITLFDVKVHQDLSRNYIPHINNFIFKPCNQIDP